MLYATKGDISDLSMMAGIDWIRKLILWIVRTFTGLKTYGPIEFFMTTMVMDMKAPQFGNYRLEVFF